MPEQYHLEARLEFPKSHEDPYATACELADALDGSGFRVHENIEPNQILIVKDAEVDD